MKRLASLLVAAMLLVSIVVAATLALGGPGTELSPAINGSPRSAAPPVEMSPPVPVAIAPIAYGEPGSPSPTNQGGQSRLWFHDNAWWGVLLSANTGEHRIFRLDAETGSWRDSGVVVDERAYARMDVLWDGVHLVAASAGPDLDTRHALRIVRFSYDPESRAYLRDANFPVPITDRGVEGVTVARSEDGRLWVAYRLGSRMVIDHSVDGDLAWRGPFVPEVADGTIERLGLVALGDRVSVVWTRPSSDEVFMASHDVTGVADQWVLSASAPVPGLSLGEDDLSMAVDSSPGADRVFAVVRTSANDVVNAGRTDPRVVLVEFPLDGPPRSHLFGRVSDAHANPIILIDAEARQLYVVATAPERGGSIYYKRSPLDDIAFPSGFGNVMIPASDELPRIGDPTSTKQALDSASGLLVAAADASRGQFAFGALGMRELLRESPVPSEGSVVTPLFENTFDGLVVGAAVPGWIVEGDPTPSFVISVLGGTDSSARLSSTATTAQACAFFPEATAGEVRVEAEFLFNLATLEDLNLIQVRGAGELASIRLRDREVSYFDGLTRIRTDLLLAPGRWYRSVLTLDLDTQTYSLEVRDAAIGTIGLQVGGLGWRSTEASEVNRICTELPPMIGLDVYLDDVRVTSTIPGGE